MPTVATVYERAYISQNSIAMPGIVIAVGGVPTNADGSVTANFYNEYDLNGDVIDPPTLIFSRAATQDATGVYAVTLSSIETGLPGAYRIEWNFTLATVVQKIISYYIIGQPAPAYDTLMPYCQEIVEQTWLRLADLFDSPFGGPALQTYFQTNFGRGRIAQLLPAAMNRINYGGPQPITQYDAIARFPQTPLWDTLVVRSLMQEIYEHLQRSYSEIFDLAGVDIPYANRADYANKWAGIQKDAEKQFSLQLSNFKIAHMGLGRGRVMASGGVFGEFGPTRLPASAAARPRYWATFYA